MKLRWKLSLCCAALALPAFTWPVRVLADELPLPDSVEQAPAALPANGQLGPGMSYQQGWATQGEAPCESCGHHHHLYPWPICDWLFSPCNMTQRYPYYPKDHGHYYFRPYHMHRVEIQRGIAAGWGEDPRNPYAHAVFDRIYTQLRSETAAEELPMVPDMPPVEGAVPPTPAPPVPAPPLPAPADEPEEESAKAAPRTIKLKSLRPVSVNAAKR